MIRSDSETTRLEAARIIATGGLIAFRTDTFYGLGADPLIPTDAEKNQTSKGQGREQTNTGFDLRHGLCRSLCYRTVKRL